MKLNIGGTMMGTVMNGIKVYFVSEKNDIKEIRLTYHNGKKYADLSNGTYAVVNIQGTQRIHIYQKLSPMASFFSIGGYPLLGEFDARQGCYYEIRYRKQGLLWKAVAREVGPF